jgi:hypothetical protein
MLFFTLGMTHLLHAQDRPNFPVEYTEQAYSSTVIFKKTSLPIDIEDTLIENHLYIGYVYWGGFKHSTCLLVSEGQHWRIFQLHEEHLEYSIEFVDLKPSSDLELLLTYTYGSGRSGWQSGYAQIDWGVMLVDLRSFTKVFNWENIKCYTFWQNDLEEDKEDPDQPIKIVGGSGEKELGTELRIEVSPGQLKIREVLADCASEFTLTEAERNAELERLKKLDSVVYTWDGEMLQRK